MKVKVKMKMKMKMNMRIGTHSPVVTVAVAVTYISSTIVAARALEGAAFVATRGAGGRRPIIPRFSRQTDG
jgi:hypothetical protein